VKAAQREKVPAHDKPIHESGGGAFLVGGGNRCRSPFKPKIRNKRPPPDGNERKPKMAKKWLS
jgi:hypothetical protein